MSKRPNGDRTSLKSISLGDAYYSLEQLKKEDKERVFSTTILGLTIGYFLKAWRKLFIFRNKMAHWRNSRC